MFRSTHPAMYIATILYLVVNCLLVSSGPTQSSSSSCWAPALNSRRESFVRLNNEVSKMTGYVNDLSSTKLSKNEIVQLARAGLCSEQRQNQDRAFLAQNQAPSTKSHGDSMETLKTINGMIDQIITLLQGIESEPVTTEKANTNAKAIAGIRVNAKPLNVKLMNNAGYQA